MPRLGLGFATEFHIGTHYSKVAFGGASFGHRLVGLKVIRFSDGGAATPIQALIRCALLVPLITAITFDEDGRGINERFSNTVLVKTR